MTMGGSPPEDEHGGAGHKPRAVVMRGGEVPDLRSPMAAVWNLTAP